MTGPLLPYTLLCLIDWLIGVVLKHLGPGWGWGGGVKYEGWMQTLRSPLLHQTIRNFEILTSRKLSNQTQPDAAYPCAQY